MTTDQPPTETCCHHWMIEAAPAPISSGVCRFCHEQREFKNTIDVENGGWVATGRTVRATGDSDDEYVESASAQ